MNNMKVLLNGIIKENPTFVLLLGMCPTLGTTSSAMNGMSMGLATTAVLVFSNLIISLIKKLIPDMVRIPSFIVVIASLVTILQMLIKAYAPEVDASLAECGNGIRKRAGNVPDGEDHLEKAVRTAGDVLDLDG